MTRLKRQLGAFFPATDLRGITAPDARRDLVAALVVTALAVPQGIAYAMIAGLPPALGLYAGILPAIVGALMRSSRHVITGPTNAVSLLVGSAIGSLATGYDPISVAVTLAFIVGVFQVAAGVLRLGIVVDYISAPVVLGYITGAATLIAVGQLPNVTGTDGVGGNLFMRLGGWFEGLGGADWLALLIAALTAAGILVLQKLRKTLPASLIALAAVTAITWSLGLHDQGLRTVADITPVPQGFPPLSLPSFDLLGVLIPIGVATTVLSLVESSSVARSLAVQSGQRIDMSVELSGQGMANLAASLTTGYPTSGSLARSALNANAGGESRLAGIASGLLLLGVLLVAGPLVDQVPIAALAGMLMIIAWNLVDLPQIRTTFHSRSSDKIAFAVTLLGTWTLPLDWAIYFGVGVSITTFLRRARLLVVHQLAVDRDGLLREIDITNTRAGLTPDVDHRQCDEIHLLALEGRLFFAVANELQMALDEAIDRTEAHVIILRLKRTQGTDLTVSQVLEEAGERLHNQDRHLLLAGVRPRTMELLERTGTVDALGRDNVFKSRNRWFVSVNAAIERALELVGPHCDRSGEPCPLADYLATQESVRHVSQHAVVDEIDSDDAIDEAEIGWQGPTSSDGPF